MEDKILKIINKSSNGIKYNDIIKKLKNENLNNVLEAINNLENNFEIIKEDGKYFTLNRLGYIKGEIQITSAGTGFLLTDDTVLGDILINRGDLNNALNKDIVLVKVKKNKFSRNNLRIGTVIRVLKRNSDFYIGEIFEDHNKKYIIVKDNDITLFTENKNLVVGNIVQFKLGIKNIKPYDIKILGHVNDPDISIKIVLAKYGVEDKFSSEIYREIENLPDEVTLTEKDEERIDLSNELFVTIDGEDAKDLDDAVSVTKISEDIYRLKVSIADVSYYVTENSLLDQEALKRGTSIYLVNKVIPMLPHKLSNGICSLNPNVIRYTITCEMDINLKGKVINSKIYPSFICSKHRLTYTYVNEVLNNKAKYDCKDELISKIILLEELAYILMKERETRGSINFEIDESKIIVNDKNEVIDIILRTRDIGEKLIEEFMLKANETVCETISRLNLPFIYRNHDKPNKEKLDRLYKILENLDISFKKNHDTVYSKTLQQILKQVENTNREKIISSLMLRSMAKANYGDKNVGHFGLSSEYYTHFTSPIRRYPDLIVHRLIRTYLFNKNLDLKTINKYENTLYDIGVKTSKSERLAIDIEREVSDIKKSEYVLKMEFPQKALISSVTNFGLFVQLENTIEGLIPLSLLKGEYTFFEDYLVLVNKVTAECFQINDEITVDLERSDINTGKITFNLVEVLNPHKYKNK